MAARINPPSARGYQQMVEPAERLARMLAGRWTLAVLGELSKGGRRYQDLHNALGHVSHKVLTDKLRRAERDGLVARHLDDGRVETATLYQLTDLGRSLREPLAAFDRWTEAQGYQVEHSRRRWDGRSPRQ